MAVRQHTEITYVCDLCGAEQSEPFRLKGKVRVMHDLLDYQGAAVAGWDRTDEVCPTCLARINALLAELRKSRAESDS